MAIKKLELSVYSVWVNGVGKKGTDNANKEFLTEFHVLTHNQDAAGNMAWIIAKESGLYETLRSASTAEEKSIGPLYISSESLESAVE